MRHGVANRVALGLATVAMASGWIDTLLCQQFIAREFPAQGYPGRNFQFVSPDIIMIYITSSPGIWDTLCCQRRTMA